MALDTLLIRNLGDQIKRIGTETAGKLNALFTVVRNHVRAKGNPHGLVAADINLGRVPNYGPATKTQAAGGVNNNTIMTPKRTVESLEENVYEPLGIVFRDAATRLP